MVNAYLVVAYALLWGIFMAYAWILHGREKSLERDVAELKSELGQQGSKTLKSQI